MNGRPDILLASDPIFEMEGDEVMDEDKKEMRAIFSLALQTAIWVLFTVQYLFFIRFAVLRIR